VLLVHHARKGGHVRPGQALRGSSELHAWGDSNLYLRRFREHVVLSIEHRAAPSGGDLELELHRRDDALALRIRAADVRVEKNGAPSATERVEEALRHATQPIARRALRAACRMRMATMIEALDQLTERGRVVEVDGGLRLSP